MMVEEEPEEPTKQEKLEQSDGSVDLRILTINVWGIPGVSADRLPRLDGICQQVLSASEPLHYVHMQEVWSTQDYNRMAAKLKEVLPYSHYFHSGVIGSGMCIFSCTPLSSVYFHLWSVNGLPHKVYHGDWWGGKGVALCRTQFNGHNIVLATTHLHAVYQHLHDEYLHHRVVQAYETSQLLRWLTPHDHTLILAGDLNCEPHQVPYRLIRDNGGLIDAFAEAPNKPVDGVGASNETPGNSYTAVAALRLDPTGKRIDHILYKPSHHTTVSVASCSLPWPLRVPGAAFSFSDHEAVAAVLTLRHSTTDYSSNTAEVASNSPSPHRSLPNHNHNHHHSTSLDNPRINGNTAATTGYTNHSSKHNRNTTDLLHEQTDTLLDSAAICAQGMRQVQTSWNFYMFLSSVMAVINLILIGVICDQCNYLGGVVFLLLLLLMFSVLVMMYSLWLVFVWNKIERNAVLATQLGLECLLEDIRKKNAVQFYKSAFSNEEKNMSK